MNIWNKKSIDKAFDDFYEKEGRWPKYVEMGSKNNLPSMGPVNNRYGTLNKYYESRNIYLLQDKHITKNKVDNMVKEFISIHKRFPVRKDFDTNNALCSSSYIKRLFGTFNKFLLEYEIVPEKLTNYWNKERIIENYLERITDINVILTQKEIAERSANDIYFPSYTIIYEYFGGLENLYEELGIKYHKRMGAYSIPITDEKHGYFSSQIEYKIFLTLLKYFTEDNINRQEKYNTLFSTGTKHTADFYIPKLDIIIEATTKRSGMPDYNKTKQWKLGLSNNVYFVYEEKDIDNLMFKLGVRSL